MTTKSMRTLMPTSPALLVAVAATFLAFVSLFIGAFNGGEVGGSELIAIGLGCFAIMCTAVWVRKSFDVLEPIVLMTISSFIGGTLRSMYIVWSPKYYDVVYFLIGNMSESDLASYETFIPLSLISLSMGYILWKKRLPIEMFRPLNTTVWPSLRVYIFVAVFSIVGVIGVILLIKNTGVQFTGLAALSAKRTVNDSGTGGQQFSQEGYLRWVAQCLEVALLILYTAWASRRDSEGKPRKFGPVRSIILLGLGMACMAWPILSSSRTEVVGLVFAIMVIYIYERNQGRLTRFITIGGSCLVFALSALVIMGLWRSLAQHGEMEQAPIGQTIADQTLGSGDFMPVERTGYIMGHFAGQQYTYGTSYLTWLAEPIPQSMWPNKPSASDIGAYVKGVIYQRAVEQGGYPPGMMGEAFINFGYPGLLFIPFMFGCLMRFTYATFKPLLGVNKNATVWYAGILWPIGLQVADLDFSHIVINVGTITIPLMLFFFCMKRPPGQSVQAHV